MPLAHFFGSDFLYQRTFDVPTLLPQIHTYQLRRDHFSVVGQPDPIESVNIVTVVYYLHRTKYMDFWNGVDGRIGNFYVEGTPHFDNGFPLAEQLAQLPYVQAWVDVLKDATRSPWVCFERSRAEMVNYA